MKQVIKVVKENLLTIKDLHIHWPKLTWKFVVLLFCPLGQNCKMFVKDFQNSTT